MKVDLNKIENFKKQFGIVKTVKFKRGKKMDKKTLVNIQLLIKSLFQDGELDHRELLEVDKLKKIGDNVFEMVETLLPSHNDRLILDEYRSYIQKCLRRSIKITSPKYSKKEIQSIKDQISYLKTIPQPEQRTPEWYTFRNNRLTASDLGTVMGVNPYEVYNKVIQKKCGLEMPFVMNKFIKRGVKYEDVIIAIYSLRNKVKVFEYGCVPHPTLEHFGASPDGIVDSESENQQLVGRMLEIKCPGGRPITGLCPEYYYCQVQGQLEVCDLEYCDFVECKIADYESKTDYFDDYYRNSEGEIDYRYSGSGLEKGSVIEAFDSIKGKEVYWYVPIGLTYEQQFEYEKNILEKEIEPQDHLEYLTTTYWKATEYHELLIQRKKDWFREVCVPKINQFWSDVEHYRTRPQEEIEALVKVNKKKPESTLEKFVTPNKTLFLSDSDEDSD